MDGNRCVSRIAEVADDLVAGACQVHDLFRRTKTANDGEDSVRSLRWTGRRPAFADELEEIGLRHLVRLTEAVFAHSE